MAAQHRQAEWHVVQAAVAVGCMVECSMAAQHRQAGWHVVQAAVALGCNRAVRHRAERRHRAVRNRRAGLYQKNISTDCCSA